jgi:Leucine rich repeat variant.
MLPASITEGDNAQHAATASGAGGIDACVDHEIAARIKIAASINTSLEVLHALACDTISAVRTAVALNPRTPNPVLAILARDKDPKVRMALARSLSTNIELLRLLALDTHEEVSAAARLSFKIAEIEMNAMNLDFAKDSAPSGVRRRIA